MKPVDQKIYLASKSPRRRELLRQIGIDFELLMLRDQTPRGPDVSEIVLPGEAAEVYVARVTQEKVAFAWKTLLQRRLPLRPVLAADTTVVIDGDILGKPVNKADAIAMLQRLSGRTHQVLTGIAVQHQSHTAQQDGQPDDQAILHALHCSTVTFDSLSDATIQAYCASQEPYDKAGGYGIQGMAASFISHISGSHSGIMGLPLFETAQLLRRSGIRL
ncbi:MAG: Maf family protein [Pseudomonadota bacterium]